MGKRSGGMKMGNNGGIAGSGIYGMFGTGIVCKSEDNSYYCNFVKFFNAFMMLLMFIFIVYFIYNFVIKPYFFSKRGR